MDINDLSDTLVSVATEAIEGAYHDWPDEASYETYARYATSSVLRALEAHYVQWRTSPVQGDFTRLAAQIEASV